MEIVSEFVYCEYCEDCHPEKRSDCEVAVKAQGEEFRCPEGFGKDQLVQCHQCCHNDDEQPNNCGHDNGYWPGEKRKGFLQCLNFGHFPFCEGCANALGFDCESVYDDSELPYANGTVGAEKGGPQ